MKTVLLYVSLIFLLVFNTAIGFNYWRNQDAANLQSQFAFLRKENLIVQSVSTENGMRLIPYGALKGENDVDELVYTYRIQLEDNQRLDITNTELDIRTEHDQLNAEGYFTITVEVLYVDDEWNESKEAVVTVSIRLEPSSLNSIYRLNGARVTLYMDYLPYAT